MRTDEVSTTSVAAKMQETAGLSPEACADRLDQRIAEPLARVEHSEIYRLLADPGQQAEGKQWTMSFILALPRQKMQRRFGPFISAPASSIPRSWKLCKMEAARRERPSRHF
jgi:hypothetical protein